MEHLRDKVQPGPTLSVVTGETSNSCLCKNGPLADPVRNTRFPSEDDELLRQLKGESLSWDEISGYFGTGVDDAIEGKGQGFNVLLQYVSFCFRRDPADIV